jgi:hypothetical protein
LVNGEIPVNIVEGEYEIRLSRSRCRERLNAITV